jgi:hypothetical protein
MIVMLRSKAEFCGVCTRTNNKYSLEMATFWGESGFWKVGVSFVYLLV